MDMPVSPAQSDLDPSPSPASLPGRDHLADADPSMIRKRPRLTPPTGSDEPLVLEILEPDEPDEQPAVIEIMADDSFEHVSYLESFPFSRTDVVPEAAAQQLANALNDSNQHFSDHDIHTLGRWLQTHLNTTQYIPDTEMHRMYIEQAPFWAQFLRCLDALAHRRHHSTSNLRLASFRLRAFEDLLVTFVCLCVRLLRAEVQSLTEVTLRRDSANPLDNSTKHKLLFISHAELLSKIITGNCSLAKLFAKDSQGILLRRHMIVRFTSEVDGADALAQLFSNVLTNSEAIHHAFASLRTYLLLTRALLPLMQDTHIDNQSFTRNVATIFSCGDATLLLKICKIHPDALAQDYHIDIVQYLRDILDFLVDQGQPPITEQFAHSMSETMAYERTHTSNGKTLPSTSDSRESEPRLCIWLAWYLEALRKFLTSSIMTLRVAGLTTLNSQLLQLWKEHCQTPSQDHLIQYAVRFHLKNDLTAYLLGPDSHADLIRRSQDTIGFLIANKCLPESDSDIMWQASFANSQSDTGEAASSLLSSLIRNMDHATIMRFCRKYRDLAASQVSPQALRMFNHLTGTLLAAEDAKSCPGLFFEAASICLGVLQVASWDDYEDLQTVLLNMTHLILRTESHDYRLNILQSCVSGLRRQHSSATGSIHAIFGLWKTEVFSARDLMKVLSLHEISNELCEYVRLARNDAENWSERHLMPRITLVVSLLTWLSDVGRGMDDSDADARQVYFLLQLDKTLLTIQQSCCRKGLLEPLYR